MSSPSTGVSVEPDEPPALPSPPPVPEPPCIGLKEVYTLLNKSSRVSRNVRAQWYFSLLAQDKFAVHKYESIQDFQDRGEMDIVGLVPEEARPVWEWDWDVSHLYNYRLTPLSQVHFLSQRYSSVFVLDLSPSGAAQDSFLTSGALDKFLGILREALVNLARPFYIPGSQLLFKPDIFVTVMAWTPFLTSTTYLVLKQGWLLTSENVDQLLGAVIRTLLKLEDVVSDTNSVVQDDITTIRSESERMMGALFDHPSQPPLLGPSVHVSSSDSAFVSMIKAAVLGLQLLPTNTTSSIIYIGDAIMSLPDIDKCDSVLNSLRTLSISLSFLKVLDRSHADASLTNGPNFDLLKFIALSTYGTFLTELPKIQNEDYVYNMNAYHEAFLCWSFRKTLDQLRQQQMDMLKNKYFLSVDNLGVQKILNMDVKSCFTSVLSCRLREGYLMSHVNVSSKENRISVVLTLPWKISSSIHYKLSSPWPLKTTNETKVELQLEGDYDIIHDIICQRDKYFDSGERNSIIRKFYVIVTHLTRVDRLLAHLESFAKVKANYSIPDTIAGGIPLFHVPPNMQKPELYQVDPTSGAFVSFWRPICSLDINVWHRWMHTHRVNALMHHDYPWPKHLLSPNSSGRYTIVQSRKAMSQLTNVLKSNSSFTLVEGQSYVKFLFKEENDKVPFTFYIIRLTCIPPCVVIWVAFLGGTSGVLRHHEVQNLKQSLSSLTITQSNPWKFNHEVTEQNACTQIQKPLDKVLIRYLNAPKNVECMIDPELFNSAKARSQSPGPMPRKLHSVSPMGGFFITLTQYLNHVRWVWNIVDTCQRPVVCSPAAVARILQMVIKMRLLQGFYFAYSKNGVQNLVSEVQSKHDDESPQPFILQYIVYPLSSSPSPSVDFSTDEGEDMESIVADREACTTVVSEVWIEPQNGHVITEGPFEGCESVDVSKIIFETDHEVISLHATVEHLAVVCQKAPSTEDMIEMCHRCFNRGNSNEDVSAKRIQISTDIVGLAMASPKVEMRFSSFVQSFCLTPDFVFKHDLNQCEKLNRANDRLFTAFHEELVDLFDYEQTLTGEESRRIGEFLATSCPDLKVQFASKRHEIDEEIENLPRWKCYAKGNGKGQVLVTFLPYAHSDLKELVLQEAQVLNDKCPNLQMSKTPMPDPLSAPESFSSENPSILSFDSRKNSFSGFSSTMMSPNSRPQDDEALTRVRSESLIRIRKRTQTIDNSDAIAFGRRRRNSTHTSKVHLPSKRTDFSPAKRSRTHTFSHIKGPRNDRNASAASSVSKDETIDCSSFHPCQEHVAGSVAIPMYTFSCSEKHLLTFLMNKKTKPSLHKSLDLRWRPEESNEPDSDPWILGDQPDEFDPTFLKRIEKRFYKAFVSVLYGSLQQGAPIHNDDVQQAVDLCDVESVVEVKLNDFLSSVCQHTLGSSQTEERPKKCFENSLNHEVMRKKFSDILQKSFKNVPGPSEFYFYRNLSREQQKPTPCSAAVLGSHRQRRNTRDTSSTRDDDTSHFHLEVDQYSSKHEHEDQSQISGYISPRGDDQLSLCSNMVSELSDSNDLPGDIPLDNPLFFQISLIAQGENNFFLNLPITHLPSCYLDLANDLRQAIHELKREESSDTDQIPANLMLKLNVTLISCDFQDVSSDGILETHLMTPHILEKTDYIGKHQLNTIQRKAISEMVEDIHWMISDEIAFSKASSTHITQAMLKAIVAHVEASISKPGCSIVKCPLDFIMNREKSMEVMMEQISRIAIPNFKVIQKGRYWYLVRTSTKDSSKSKLWLILYIKDEKVNIIFQYREGQLNIVLPWRQAMQRLSVKISEALDYVNRVMLLQNLSESRICNRLLDPESPDDEEWQGASPFQDAEDEGNCLQANLNLVPGKYSCPQVWEKRFMLHPRLIETRGPDVTSRGFMALKLVMGAFAVQNRKNMFVYQDETGTYYMKLSEHISSSRHSSFVKRSNSNQSISGGLQGPRSLSISGGGPPPQMKSRHPSASASECGELEFPQKNNDFIDLKIYGVSQPGSTITESLVNVLQNKLDEKVVEVLSTILQRNPMSRLMPEDVKFLQPIESEPTKAIRFVAPTINSDYLPVLCQYLVQNLIESRFISPKFSSSRRENKLRGIGDFDEVLLLNRSKDGGVSSGQVGIGVVAFRFEKRDLGEGSDESCRTLAQLMRIQKVEADSPEDNESKLHFHFYIWELGKLDLEAMITTIHSAVQQAMWDLTLEYVLLSKRFSEFTNVDNTLVTLVNFWLPLGREMHVPSLTEKIFKMKSRTNSKFFLEDVYKTIRRIFPTGAIEVYSRFQQGHTPHERVTEKNYPSPICSSNPVLFSLTIPKSRNLEDFAANPGKSDNLRKFVLTSNSRPRSLHVMVLLHRDHLRVFYYNCSKVVTDRLNRNLQFLMDWTSLRVSLKEALAAQKVGVLKDREFFDPESDEYQECPDVEHLLQNSVPQRGQRNPAITPHAIGSSSESLSTLYCSQKRAHLGQTSTSHSTGNLIKDIAKLRLDQRHEILPLWVHRRNEVQFFLTEGVLDLVISLSRPVHFCMTPIMFLPKWRMQAHATRFKEGDLDAAEELEDHLLNAKFRGQALDEMNNNLIIKHYIKEYRQYLEWMSFVAIPCDSAFNVLNPPVAYFYKILTGGLLLFEIGSKEPFIYTKLYALEHTRIQRMAYHKGDVMKAWTSLVMECDRIKFLLHHHSFTYDFHLRALSEFAIGKINILRNGFHLTSFISNFMKYYNKSPNYARNIIFNQQLEIDLTLVQSEQLFNYVLSHEKEYGFHVLRMEPLYDDGGENFFNDFLLTTQSSHRVQALSGEKRITVEFDLTIILSCSKTSAKDSLTLKGVFIFTQKNDQFPILYKEQNHKGIFKPVLGTPFSMANHPVMNHSPNQGEDPIDPENVLYIGYYSSHEQSIQSMVDRESKHLKAKLSQIFQNAERDCRKDALWRKILLDTAKPDHTIEEFEELVSLIETQTMSNPFSSFSFESESLKKRLQEWLSDYFPLTFRHLSSNYQEHFVITDENMFSVAAVFSIDYGTPQTEVSIYSLNRSPESQRNALHDTLCNVVSYFLFRETF